MGEGESGEIERGGVNSFVKHWGWLYVVFQMAEFFRESRNDQYKKGIIEFYNDLSFMKDHEKWKVEILEKQALENKLNGYGN